MIDFAAYNKEARSYERFLLCQATGIGGVMFVFIQLLQ